MNILRTLAIIVCVLLLGACEAMAPEPATIGSSTRIVEPGGDVSSDYAAFSGIWSGSWDNILDGKLAVKDIQEDGAVSVVYAWGDHPRRRFFAGSTETTGRISDGVLALERFNNGAVAEFAMKEDGTLAASYDLQGNVSTAVFRKQE